MDESTLFPCPICNHSFDPTKIEHHVDLCLQNAEKKKPTTRSEVFSSPNKTTSNFFQRRPKRKPSESPSAKEKKMKITENPTKKETSLDSEILPADDVLVVNEQSESNDSSQPLQSQSQREKNEFQETLLKWSNETNITRKKNIQVSSNTTSPKTLKKHPLNNISGSPKEFSTPVARPRSSDQELKKCNAAVQSTIANGEQWIQSVVAKPVVILGKAPLADQMRPTSFDHYFGQEAVNSTKILKELFYTNVIPSIILWGPPGCGKTSLTHIISMSCKSGKKYRFMKLSATMSNVNEVREVVKVAKNERKLTQRQTVLFMDEVHRFNKTQQDSFLPHIEDGTIIFIGATTENPSFHLNNALLSRCKLVVLQQLSVDSIVKILQRAVHCLHGFEVDATERQKEGENIRWNSKCKGGGEEDEETKRFLLEDGALKMIAETANGDARTALNSLENILLAKLNKNQNNNNKDNQPPTFIKVKHIKEELRRGYVNYDRNGDDHYDIISAFHKSIRGGDANASLYWLARMLEGGETPLYVARRLVRIASEDIGLADPSALTQAVSAYQACHFLGMPECDVILAQVATYLARAPKSIEVYEAYNNVKNLVREWSGTQPSVPLHLRNAPTGMMKKLGYGKGYKYTPKCLDDPEQEYLPKQLKTTNFFDT